MIEHLPHSIEEPSVIPKAELADFLNSITELRRGERLFPPNPPDLDRETLCLSAENLGFRARRLESDKVFIYENDSRWNWTISSHASWRRYRSREAGVSFTWELDYAPCYYGALPKKLAEKFEQANIRNRPNAQTQLLNTFTRHLAKKLFGIPPITVEIPEKITPNERARLLATIPLNDPLQGFLNGAFDDCVYRLETEHFAGTWSSLIPKKTEHTVKNVFVSTDPEDILWSGEQFSSDLAYQDLGGDVRYSMKVIRPKHFRSSYLDLKSGHNPNLDTHEIALDEGTTLAIIPLEEYGTSGRTRQELLVRCVRAPRKLHEYQNPHPEWGVSWEKWRQERGTSK